VTTKTIEKINKARFEEDILRRTTYEEFRRGSTGGRIEAIVVEVISIEEPTVSISWKGTSLDQTPTPKFFAAKKQQGPSHSKHS
jgi:hypothetical protein